jgi:hypothetical protein
MKKYWWWWWWWWWIYKGIPNYTFNMSIRISLYIMYKACTIQKLLLYIISITSIYACTYILVRVETIEIAKHI